VSSHDEAAGLTVSRLDGAGDSPVREPRWPPLAAVVVFLGLNVGLRLWLPGEVLVGVPWLLPTIEVLLLIVLLAADPSNPAKRREWPRRLLPFLVGLLNAAALWATAFLIYHLIAGAEVTESPGMLLAAAALVWIGNNLSFALLFWLLDSGGPLERARGERQYRDFAFTQHMTPELAPADWRPVFADYLHLGFTNATAFSPTDVMPLTMRGKYAMLVHSTVALALFGLVVARAVNAFT
jgi:uncharacterized membrane protein